MSPGRPLRVWNALRSALNELAVPSAKRIPFLDGLRALAILLVINHHVGAVCEARYGATRYTSFPLTTNGWMGVDLFFVLSGFFIGTQLWKELLRTGSIGLRNFMVRRTLRIWPLYFFTYAAVLLRLPAFGAAKQYGWGDLVFLVNYLGHGVVLGGWSLSTEEQFYLAAPLLLLIFRRRSLRWFRWMLAFLWLTEIIVRIAEYVHRAGALRVKNAAAFEHIYYPFHTHSDGLIAGMLVANLLLSAKLQQHAKSKGQLARTWAVLTASVVAMLVCWVVQSETLNFTGLALLFAGVVWWGIHGHSEWMKQRFFYVVSRLSFGMYLNHAYLIEPARHALQRFSPQPVGALWTAPVLAALVACMSAVLAFVTFCLVEHPFLLLRTVLLRRTEVVPLVAH